jgi:hypothetical protein
MKSAVVHRGLNLSGRRCLAPSLSLTIRWARLRGQPLMHCRTVVPLASLVEFLAAVAPRRLTEQAGNWVEARRPVRERSRSVPAPPLRPTPRLGPERPLSPPRSRKRPLVPSRNSERILHPRPREATRLSSGLQTRRLLGALGLTRGVHHGPIRQSHHHPIRQARRRTILYRHLRRRSPHHLTQRSCHHRIPLPRRFQKRQPPRHLDRRGLHSTQRVHRHPYQQGRLRLVPRTPGRDPEGVQRGPDPQIPKRSRKGRQPTLRVPHRQTPRAPGWGRATTQQAPHRSTPQTPQRSRHPTRQAPHQRVPRTRRSG